jgi:hypothetical protein
MRLVRSITTSALAAVAAAVGLLLASPAGAQEGGGVITMEGAHPAGTSVHFIVRVTWGNDGDPATEATVTATAVDSDGNQLTPVTLAPIDEDGRYANVIDFTGPGSWTVRLTSVNPAGTTEITQEVGATAGADAGAGGEDGAFAPADDGTGASGQASDGDDDGGMPVWLVVAAAVVAVGGGFLSLRTVRRYRAEAAAEAAQSHDAEAARATTEAPEPGGHTDPGHKARQ